MGYLLSLQTLDDASGEGRGTQFASTFSASVCVSTASASIC
ncbi:class III lanthipeptide [Microbacterium hatanonis]|jgi:hypothetical protein|nr:class III lanthipeptide [Microbacterium hatanonis]RKT31648.1 hypothetical protein DEU34_2722 [Microbacterium sp. AG1240]